MFKIKQKIEKHLRSTLIAIFKYSVQFSCSVMSDSLQPHGLQHARPSCPSPTPKVYLDLNVLWFQQNAWIETKGFSWTYELLNCNISSVQSLSRVQLFATPWTTAHQASLSITNSQSLLKLMSIESVMPYNHLILCRPLLLLPSIFPSIRVFSNESALCIRWPKCWSFSFNISPSNEHPGLISFRMDWLDLLAGQGTLKSLLQHHSSKASILQHSAFFIVQISHSYMTTQRDFLKEIP